MIIYHTHFTERKLRLEGCLSLALPQRGTDCGSTPRSLQVPYCHTCPPSPNPPSPHRVCPIQGIALGPRAVSFTPNHGRVSPEGHRLGQVAGSAKEWQCHQPSLLSSGCKWELSRKRALTLSALTAKLVLQPRAHFLLTILAHYMYFHRLVGTAAVREGSAWPPTPHPPGLPRGLWIPPPPLHPHYSKL